MTLKSPSPFFLFFQTHTFMLLLCEIALSLCFVIVFFQAACHSGDARNDQECSEEKSRTQRRARMIDRSINQSINQSSIAWSIVACCPFTQGDGDGDGEDEDNHKSPSCLSNSSVSTNHRNRQERIGSGVQQAREKSELVCVLASFAIRWVGAVLLVVVCIHQAQGSAPSRLDSTVPLFSCSVLSHRTMSCHLPSRVLVFLVSRSGEASLVYKHIYLSISLSNLDLRSLSPRASSRARAQECVTCTRDSSDDDDDPD